MAIVLASIVIPGCATSPFEGTSWPQPRPLGGDLEAFRPTSSLRAKTSEPGFEEPAGSLSLRDALGLALLHSPDLAATAYEVRAREAEILQAGLPPNPEIEFELEEVGGSGALEGIDAAGVTLTLSQLVELGGKRVKRQRAAGYEAQSAGWDYEIRRIDVLTGTAADFVDVLAAERRLEIALQTARLAKQVSDAVEERVTAGKAPPLDRARASVDLARAEVRLQKAEHTLRGARISLASNWGSTEPRFAALLGDLDLLHAPPPLETLLARVEQSPDLARWAAEAALRQAEIELALARGVPDLTAAGGVKYFNETDDYAFVLALSVPLPVFDWNQGGIQAARIRAIRDGRLEEAERVRVRTALAVIHQAIDAAYLEVAAMRDRILPAAELAFSAAEEAFRQGKADALALFDAQHTLLNSRLQLVDALRSYHLAVIAGERLIGAPLHDEAPTTGDD